MGKEAILCSSGPFKRTEILEYENFFTTKPLTMEGDRVIVLDCSSFERTGDLEAYLNGFPRAFIDHHESGNSFRSSGSDKEPLLLDEKAPSTTFLVYKLIIALDLVPNREEAELLFFGLCTDTGFFRHISRRGEEIFTIAAHLIALGANPKSAFAAIHGGKSLDSRKLIGHILIRAEPHFDGKLILSYEKLEETKRFGLEGRDTDTLYQVLQNVKGVEAIVIIRQESPEYCTVGFRSRDAIDVGRIAQSFGGGGHRNAAGLKINGTIDSLIPDILSAFENAFNKI